MLLITYASISKSLFFVHRAHPVRLDPKGPLVQGVRKGAMEDADHPGLVDLREFR